MSYLEPGVKVFGSPLRQYADRSCGGGGAGKPQRHGGAADIINVALEGAGRSDECPKLVAPRCRGSRAGGALGRSVAAPSRDFGESRALGRGIPGIQTAEHVHQFRLGVLRVIDFIVHGGSVAQAAQDRIRGPLWLGSTQLFSRQVFPCIGTVRPEARRLSGWCSMAACPGITVHPRTRQWLRIEL